MIANRIRRHHHVRKLERHLRFSGKQFVTLGDRNFHFYRPGWETVDLFDADHVADVRKGSLPFENETLDAVYCSHLIEHISFESGLQLFEEIYRCLKHKGRLRLVAPDMDLLIDRYRKKDWRFFLEADGSEILRRINKGDLMPEALLMHNRLVGWFASYSGRLDTAGGPIVEQQLVEEKLATLSKYEFRNWCVSLLEPGRVYAHVHVYDYIELRSSLEKAGFQDIQKLSYGETSCSEMLNPPIDLLKHKSYSLYVEAIK